MHVQITVLPTAQCTYQTRRKDKPRWYYYIYLNILIGFMLTFEQDSYLNIYLYLRIVREKHVSKMSQKHPVCLL